MANLAVNSTMVPGSAEKNKLIGWLVSYEIDPKGKPFEIRVGRTLITSEKPPHNDSILLQSPDISAPHLAIKASSDHKLFIQDIFSNNGSFLVKSGTNNEVPVTTTTEVSHGDLIKIGKSTKFKVCLIDDPNR